MSDYIPYVPVGTYVPTDDEVETAFHEFASWLEAKYPGEYEHAPEFVEWREAMHGFRRWKAALIREAKAEAWDEGHGAFERAWESDHLYPYDYVADNPYREETE